jgi:ornithine cyclodeaminase/alanine dehydrogenase-like protein (mu-crystallin family)
MLRQLQVSVLVFVEYDTTGIALQDLLAAKKVVSVLPDLDELRSLVNVVGK